MRCCLSDVIVASSPDPCKQSVLHEQAASSMLYPTQCPMLRKRWDQRLHWLQTFGGTGVAEQLHLHRTAELEALDFDQMAAS